MRSVVLVALAAALGALALGMRRRRPATRPQRPAPAPVPRGSPPKGRVAAAALALAALVAAAVGGWRLSLAGEPEADVASSASAPVATATPLAPTATTVAPTPTLVSPTPTASAAAPQPWRLLAGGDVLMDLTEAAGIDPFAGIVPPLAGADLAAVNVEMAIATGGTPEAKTFVFRVPPSAAQTMAAASIDVGSLGNNHSLDYGLDALFETTANLRSAGVAPVGGGANEGEAYAPASFDIAGVRVAVIGASRVLPRVEWAARDGPGLASAYDEDRLVAAVRGAKASHDVVIVMVHWGEEGAPCPNDDQRRLGGALLRAGASVLLGSHPHVLQPVVRRPAGLIAYSLGNFVWHPRSGRAAETGVLEVRFEGARIAGFQLHPHVIDPQGAPVPAGPLVAARIGSAVSRPCVLAPEPGD